MLKTFSGEGSGSSALAGVEKRLAGRVPDDDAVPAPVRMAVRLMLAGAAITLAAALFSVIVLLSDPPLFNDGKQPTSSQLTQAVVYALVSSLIFVAVWVAMARANRAGRAWARIVASVLFVIATLNLYGGIGSLQGSQATLVLNIVSFALSAAEWICGLVAIALLWRGESGGYFKQRAADR